MTPGDLAVVGVAAVAAGVGAAFSPDAVGRFREGATFRATLPGRWLLALVAGVATGLMALSLSRQGWGPSVFAVLPAYVWLGVIGTVMGFVDVALHRLPDVMTLPAYPVVGVLLVLAALVVGEPRRLLAALVGTLALFGLYFILWFVNPAGMGFGDVKLSGVLGMGLGFLGANAVFVGAMAGFLVSGAISLTVLVRQRSKGLRAEVPHGPGMLVGFVVGVVLA